MVDQEVLAWGLLGYYPQRRHYELYQGGSWKRTKHDLGLDHGLKPLNRWFFSKSHLLWGEGRES